MNEEETDGQIKKEGMDGLKNATPACVNSATLLAGRWSLLLKMPHRTLMCSALRTLKLMF